MQVTLCNWPSVISFGVYKVLYSGELEGNIQANLATQNDPAVKFESTCFNFF